MNWVLYKSENMPFHTDLNILFKPILDDINNFHWFLSDLEFSPWIEGETLLMEKLKRKYCILTNEEFNKLLAEDIQMIWASLLGRM